MTLTVIYIDKQLQTLTDVATFQHIGTKLDYYTTADYGRYTRLENVIGVAVSECETNKLEA